MTGTPYIEEYSSARLMISALAIGAPSSENPTAPALSELCHRGKLSPLPPFGRCADGKNVHDATAYCFPFPVNVSRNRFVIDRGFVLGMQHTAVNPPAAAEVHPDSIVSLCSKPGSRRCTCISINPGRQFFPEGQSRQSPREARCSRRFVRCAHLEFEYQCFVPA